MKVLIRLILMCHHWFLRPRFSFVCALLLAASALDPGPTLAGTGSLEPFGLDGRVVTSLGMFGALYAGTIGDGVFRRDLSDPEADWVPLGLQGKRIRAVYPHASGPLGFATAAGLEGDPLNPDSALVFCSELDQLPWVVSDSGVTRTDVTAIWSLDGFPSPLICGETFAASIGSVGGVWRRGLATTHWENVLDVGFGVGNVVRVDAPTGNVWAGGENAVLAPWIARSTDLGTTWQVAYPDLAGDNACNAIAVHPTDPDVAYAGMEGLVIETADGGATWAETGLVGTDAYIYGVALDSAAPLHLVAGGTITNPNSWALWESFDGGVTWAEVAPPAAGTSGISSILADPKRPGAFYMGTSGHGVWRYQRTATGVVNSPGRQGPRLEPNYPNPFDPTTTLEFALPVSLGRSRVHLAIYDTRGAQVRVLVDAELATGPHRITWNATDTSGRRVAPGVYYSRLWVGPHQHTRKLLLVH